MRTVGIHCHLPGARDPRKVAGTASFDNGDKLIASIGTPSRSGVEEVEGAGATSDDAFKAFHSYVRANSTCLIKGGGKNRDGAVPKVRSRTWRWRWAPKPI